MSTIKEALLALASIEFACRNDGPPTLHINKAMLRQMLEPIRAALEAAQREAVAWEAIEAWHEAASSPIALVVRLSGPFHKNADGLFFYCTLPPPSANEGPRGFKGDTRLEALESAAEWCRAQVTK